MSTAALDTGWPEWLRAAAHRIVLMADVLARHLPELEAGAVITVQRQKIRISRR